jgi:predicted RNase H-like HicB family nuclease
MKLKVLIRSEDVGGYSASIPALPGCHSQGETLEETLANTREAAELWLEVTAEAAEARARADDAGAEFQEIEL